jgi:hypothetical protein
MERKVSPDKLQMGDTIVVHQQPCQVKYVDGPQGQGAYDVYVTDPQGLPHHEIVTEPITIVM